RCRRGNGAAFQIAHGKSPKMAIQPLTGARGQGATLYFSWVEFFPTEPDLPEFSLAPRDRFISVQSFPRKAQRRFSRVSWLALQLPFMQVSESMGNHDSKIVDAASVD